MQPMATAPRDGREILVLYNDGDAKFWMIANCSEEIYRHNKWNDCATDIPLGDEFFMGWLPLPEIPEA